MSNEQPGFRTSMVAFLKSPRLWLFTAITVLGFGCDQGSKAGIHRILDKGEHIALIPGGNVLPDLSLVLSANDGAAFSMFSGWWGAMALFYVALVVVLAVVLRTLYRMEGVDWAKVVGLGLVAGGALGNGLDRVLYQAVTDFIRVSFTQPWIASWVEPILGSDTWPIFNVADVILAIGVVLLVLRYVFGPQGEPEESPA